MIFDACAIYDIWFVASKMTFSPKSFDLIDLITLLV